MKRVVFITLTCLFILGILLIPQSTITAQASTPILPAATTTPVGVSPAVITSLNPFPETPELAALERGENVSFRVLEARDSSMIGPYDSYYLDVGIPSTWKLTSGAKLNLKLNLDITIAPEAEGVYRSWLGPRLDIYFDNIFITSLRVTDDGDYTFEIPLPVSQLQPVRAGSHFLYMYLDAAYDCEFDQSTVLTVKADSFFTLPHDSVKLTPNLNNLPRPFYQFSSFLPNQVTLVVPDNPTDTELEAALTVAAGFGRMTANTLELAAVPISQLSETLKKNSHLIYVGKAGSIPALSSLSLPAPLSGAQFKAAGAAPDDGILQMVASITNPDKAIMIVGGNSDLGLKKAAQAISTGVIRATQNAQLAVVSNVVPENTTTSKFAVDRTFSDLGYENITLSGLGTVNAEYLFTLPGGYRVSDDAYLDFSYSYSGLLNFERSSVSIILNGIQVNSTPYTDEMRKESSEPVRFPLPAYAFIPGVNSLIVESSHVNEHCAFYSPTEIWTTIFNRSVLHLPQSTEVVKDIVTPNLTNFPRPLSDDPELTSIAFVVSRGNPAALFTAAKIAEDLGRQSNSNIVDLNAYYPESVTDETKATKSLVLVGKPTELPLIKELAQYLPAPFADGSNVADESGLSVSYRLAPETSIGYMEYLESPWNKERTILAALGTTTEGLQWTGTALTDPLFVTQLTGNYAVTNGLQVYGIDTLAGSGTMNIGITASPAMALTLSPSSLAVDAIPTAAVAKKMTLFDVDPKLWVPYVIVILTITTILVVLGVVWLNIKRRRDEKFRIRNKE
ncbi:MAG: cellulose biosynthesis cyclic di-GMP-binding regulatory protein BcsB [Anaerolineaceae bacterium]